MQTVVQAAAECDFVLCATTAIRGLPPFMGNALTIRHSSYSAPRAAVRTLIGGGR